MDQKRTPAERISTITAQITAKTTPNPLCHYRKISTINLQVFKELIYGKYAAYRDQCFELISKDPLFKHHTAMEMTREQQRKLAFQQMVRYHRKTNLKFLDFLNDPLHCNIAGECLFTFDAATAIKGGVHFVLYVFSIFNLGTEKHQKYIDRAMDLQDIGSFSLTELGHGSNARDINTTAVYDTSTEEFILNTPNDLSMKFWIGATADLANMTVLWAQLIIGETNYGPHVFLVPIRDLRDHAVLPGVIIGDCGYKNGNNGIDNGFLIFKNYRIPRDNLLDKFSQVLPNGEFKTTIKNSDKRFGIQLGSLSGGRITLCQNSISQLLNAVTIATRFCAVRTQFGPVGKPEQPLLEYQLIQHRLLPWVANVVIYRIAGQSVNQFWNERREILLNDFKNPAVNEFHALVSSLKALCSWTAIKGIQQCREICGGLGYSAYSRFGALLADTDVLQTFEGENNVLIQQTAKFLLDAIRDIYKGKVNNYETAKWLTVNPVMEEKCQVSEKEKFCSIENMKFILEHRANLSLQESALKLQENVGSNPDLFTAWNNTQVYYLQTAAKSYGEVFCFTEAAKVFDGCKCEKTKAVFKKVLDLWVLTRIDEDWGNFRLNDFINNDQYRFVKELLIDRNLELKDEAVGIIDAIAPPDNVLGSPLGSYDGNLYNKFLNMVMTAPGCYEKVSWWRDIHNNY